MSKFEYCNDLLKSCFLPELQRDLDSVPITTDHFAEYYKVLNMQLLVLYDFVQQQEIWLLGNDNDDTTRIRADLILLMCEITAPGSIYGTDNESFRSNAKRILQKFPNPGEAVEQLIFEYYQTKLNKDHWKRQLGAVNGFTRFLQWRFSEQQNMLSSNWLNFSLAVALNVRECSNATYKEMSTKIFLIILLFGHKEEIVKVNIHSVIYDTVFRDIYYMDSPEATHDIWNCLCCCLDFFDDISSLAWNQSDDMLEKLITNVSLAPDSAVSITLIKFITKLSIFFTINRSEFEHKLGEDITDKVTLAECREICSKNTSYNIFRWAKSILNMFVLESHKILQNNRICYNLLLELHKCYMSCILPIPLEIIHQHLYPFIEKFIAVLMEAIVLHKDPSITLVVKDFLMTFQMQLKCSSYTTENKHLNSCYNAINKLMQNNYLKIK